MSRSLKTRTTSQEWGFESDFTSTTSNSREPVSIKPSSQDSLCWLVKYAPKTRGELALHKRKVDSVTKVLTDALTHKLHKVIIMSGPPGVGKSATIRALAKDLSCSLEEWVNPIIMFEQGVYYENEIAKFKHFLLSSSRYNSLFEENGVKVMHDRNARKIVLIEELPNFLSRQQEVFWNIIKTYSRYGIHPVVLIMSDSASPVRVPSEYVNIQFNPVAATFVTRALKSICLKEQLSDMNVEEIVAQSEGDLRNAILSLRFNGLTRLSTERGTTKRRKVDTKKTNNTANSDSLACKDSTLFFFHALGKFLYAKRVKDTPFDCDDSTLGRQRLEFIPEDVAEKCAVSSVMITQYLHHNYLGFQNNIDNTLLATEVMCDSDIITSQWTTDRDTLSRLDWYGKSLTTRGVVFSKDPSYVPKFTPLCRSVQKDISKTCDENLEKCRDAFSLQHMGASSCFVLDTIPFYNKVGYKPANPTQYSLIQKMAHYKTSVKCGVSLTSKEGIDDQDDENTSKSSGTKEDIDVILSKELEEEIDDFSD